jgi:hypothetical protein
VSGRFQATPSDAKFALVRPCHSGPLPGASAFRSLCVGKTNIASPLTGMRTIPAFPDHRPMSPFIAMCGRLPVGKGCFECFCETGRCGHVFGLC